MDDPSLADITGANSNPALQGYQFTGTESPVIAALRAKLNPEQMQNLQYGNIGPGGSAPNGQPLAWNPYDPNQQLFDSHQHFGDTYDDPVYGKLQSMWKEPSKSQAQFNKIGPMIFSTALGAVTGGAGAAFMGPLLNAALQYSMGGKINPAQLALSVGGSFVPGLLGGIDPSIAQAYRIGSTALGAGSAINQASKGNYDPAINAAAGYGLKQLTGALG